MCHLRDVCEYYTRNKRRRCKVQMQSYIILFVVSYVNIYILKTVNFTHILTNFNYSSIAGEGMRVTNQNLEIFLQLIEVQCKKKSIMIFVALLMKKYCQYLRSV